VFERVQQGPGVRNKAAEKRVQDKIKTGGFFEPDDFEMDPRDTAFLQGFSTGSVEFVGKVYASTLEGDRIETGGMKWRDTSEAM